MSKIGLSLKLNVSLIEKARLFKGAKGMYLDCTTFVDLDNLDQYDNSGMITQDVTKEENDSGTRGPILGNCKVFWKGEGKQQSQSTPHQSAQQQGQPQAAASSFADLEDIPW